MLVFSDVQSLCISARLWLQVGSPKRLRSDLNQTVSFPPTLFSSSMLIVYFKSILAHTQRQEEGICIFHVLPCDSEAAVRFENDSSVRQWWLGLGRVWGGLHSGGLLKRSLQPVSPTTCISMRSYFNQYLSNTNELTHSGLSGRRTRTTGASILLRTLWSFPGGSVVENPPAKQTTQVQSLSREDPLQKEMATHSSILAWKIPWAEEPWWATVHHRDSGIT